MTKHHFFSTMAKRKNKHRRVYSKIKRRMPLHDIQKKKSEKEPDRIMKFTNSQAVIPWQYELLEPQEAIKKGGNFQRLPDRYSNLYQEQLRQNNYKNHVYRTDTIGYGVKPENMYNYLRRRDVGTTKGSAAHRVY